jgi:hypothetical protein
MEHLLSKPKEGDQCRVWLAPTRLMHPSVAHKFNRLVSIALDVLSSLGSIGLIEISNIMNCMDEKMSEVMTYDLQMHII